MKRLILVLIVLIIASGCGMRVISVQTSLTQEKSSKESTYLYIKSYEINKQKIAYIGQSMVSWRAAARIVTTDSGQPYIRFNNDFSLIGTYGISQIKLENVVINGLQGAEYEVRGVTNIDGINYYIISITDEYALLIDSNGILNKNIILASDYFNTGYQAKESTLSPPNAHFSYFTKHSKDKVEIRPYGISRELIFGGVNNVSINVAYREYTPDDMARQAFTQNLIYQTTAQTIRFQDMKIKVHEVTNEKIVFTVLEDGLGLPTP